MRIPQVTYTKREGHEGQGIFTCPGGYDDDEYKRCGFRSLSAERPTWVVTDHEIPIPRKSSKSAQAQSAPPLLVD